MNKELPLPKHIFNGLRDTAPRSEVGSVGPITNNNELITLRLVFAFYCHL